jgi:hypothetical protein
MAKSILEHQKDLIKLQTSALKEIQDKVFNAKYSGTETSKKLEELDNDAAKIIEKVDKKRDLINHYYGETVV